MGEPVPRVPSETPQVSPARWLAGRLAVVTGASRGIGAATATALAAAGAHVVLAARDRQALEGVTGFLVPPDDVGAAAEAVSKAAGMSRTACRAHAEGRLDLGLSLDAHERLYERVGGE